MQTTGWVGIRFYGKLPYQNTETRCKKHKEKKEKHWKNRVQKYNTIYDTYYVIYTVQSWLNKDFYMISTKILAHSI